MAVLHGAPTVSRQAQLSVALLLTKNAEAHQFGWILFFALGLSNPIANKRLQEGRPCTTVGPPSHRGNAMTKADRR
jgi:hypothetical protein